VAIQILAVGMLDVATFGMDAFFVRINDTDIMHYEVHRDGRIEANPPHVQTMDDVYSSVEKFNHGYLVDPPVTIGSLAELPSYLGKFEPITDTRCRYRG